MTFFRSTTVGRIRVFHAIRLTTATSASRLSNPGANTIKHSHFFGAEVLFPVASLPRGSAPLALALFRSAFCCNEKKEFYLKE